MNNEIGILLGKGKGINSMMKFSHEKHLDNSNSILIVDDTSDFNSKWKIYSKPKD